MFRKLGIAAVMATLLVACEKNEPAPMAEPTDPAAIPPAPVAPTQVTGTAQPSVELDTLPVEEDFEETAEKELTTTNLVAKLDELEKEIGSE